MKQVLKNREGGFALLLALIVSSVVLAIGISILNISVNQINLSATARESEFSFQAAHAGVDCLKYWRSEKASEYTAQSGSPSNPSINCFGAGPVETSSSRVKGDSNGTVDAFFNKFQWGSPLRCTSVDMYVINAYGGDVSTTFLNEGVGVNGVKTCDEGYVCTVLVSDGYNRACDDVSSSIFSIQRELTVEF